MLEVFVNRHGLHGGRTRARAVRVLHKLVERASMLCDDEKLLQQLQRGPLAEWVGVLLTLTRTRTQTRTLTLTRCEELQVVGCDCAGCCQAQMYARFHV